MEHILQFAVSIDEQKIVDVATNRAAAEIIKSAKEEMNKYTRGYNSKLEQMFIDEIKKVINEHKDKIIEDATNQLAANMAKTKVVKEAIAKITENV